LFELHHRGDQIKKKMKQRSNYRRRRRSKNLCYRKKRFLNRGNKKEGWLAPSILHRVDQVINFVIKMAKFAPITSVSVEIVKFDTQAMDNPDIQGVQYQQGTLAGYEVREYFVGKVASPVCLLWGGKCATSN
jgi:hypothetical protein